MSNQSNDGFQGSQPLISDKPLLVNRNYMLYFSGLLKSNISFFWWGKPLLEYSVTD